MADRRGVRLFGFYPQWSIHQRGYLVRDVSAVADRLTHLGYAFGDLDASGEAVCGDPWADRERRFGAEEAVSGVADSEDQPLAGNLNQLRQLKAEHPHLKVVVAIGGWNWSRHFHAAAATPRSRAAHVESCIDMWLKGDAAGVFDGVDLDWEWPGSDGGPGTVADPADKANFTALLREWRTRLDALGAETGRTLELTAFLPCAPERMRAGYQVPEVFDLLSSANLQGYDLHGAFERTTNHQSGIRSPAGDPASGRPSLDQGVRAWIEAGAPAHKLVLGAPCHGSGWSGVHAHGDGLFQPSAGPARGTFEPGHESYRVLKDRTGARHRDEAAGFAWLYEGGTFWTYDDPVEIARKAEYVRDRGLGGMMLWSLDGDTEDGELVEAAHRGLAGGAPPDGATDRRSGDQWYQADTIPAWP
ncbi:chitinase [Saccharopolyspora erythraea NRRL 2338]|uniref:chitinase n=2 Tax=Saccharopolyspora erythraea TaxID=1836 RepID=A4FNV0_SACEN|nr:glycoside hydrolase family 18 protein [Saccharopolyspora erythraea]EQD81963.1 glycosyl hydrolase [Saccharopolyspora erythraea D]PFG99365.1 chitinase [Saccharopolyspora erythraea NRRL 2338]QRK89289.1 glycoside hydrolase family 18 protein [Saccharopolyspora erythraea]CAM05725.1 chitinase II [Saccharopolyspora erythraea NRRL 2338]